MPHQQPPRLRRKALRKSSRSSASRAAIALAAAALRRRVLCRRQLKHMKLDPYAACRPSSSYQRPPHARQRRTGLVGSSSGMSISNKYRACAPLDGCLERWSLATDLLRRGSDCLDTQRTSRGLLNMESHMPSMVSYFFFQQLETPLC